MIMVYVRRGSALLTLLGLIALLASWRYGTQHWAAIHTGTCPPAPANCMAPPGPWYGFWSGFGSDLGEYAIAGAIIGHLLSAWRQHTCHRYWWCWRAPRYPLDGTPFCLCRRHHPDEVPTVAEAIETYKQQAQEAA